jgi:hypothetical protein
MLDIHNKEEMEALASLVSRAIAAGRIDPGAAVGPFQQAGSGVATDTGLDWRHMLMEASGDFLAALAEQLVADYGKPVISTTFVEQGTRLRGFHYSYPSSKQAAKVLAKIVEYKEYLEKIGAYKG